MSAQALAERVEDLPLAPAPSVAQSPMLALISDAIQKGHSIDVIRELKTMAKELADDEKRAAFDAAIADAKAEISPVVKTRKGHNSKYADFASIAVAVDPILSRHGLSYRHRSDVVDKQITVICRLAHKAGHFEETAIPAPADTSGNKNAIQAIGSTLTYLQRYTLLLALGLATAHDDDGKAAGIGETVSEEEILDLQSLIDEVQADLPKFLELMGVEYLDDLPKARLKEAVATLEARRSK